MLALGSCSAAETQNPQTITPQQAEAMMREEDVLILDVRTQQEFDSGHIQNAVLLPYNEIPLHALALIPEKSQIILVYCRAGRRSSIAARKLAEMGFTAVYDFGGIAGWPVVRP